MPEEKSVDAESRHAFDHFDSGAKSLLLKLLRQGAAEKIPLLKYLQVYLLLVAVTWVIPLLITWGTQPTLVRQDSDILLPFLLDLNVTMICLVSTPFLLFVFMREPSQHASTLADLYNSRIVRMSQAAAVSFVAKWEKEFSRGNIWAQVAGVAAAGAVFSMNFFGAETSEHYGRLWQTYNASSGSFNVAGWFYLLLQVSLFFFIAGQLLVRELILVKMLFDLTRVSQLEVQPLHPDKVGGLGPVARLGLTYQFGIALLGVNLGTMIITSRIIGAETQTPIIVASLILYSLLAPLVFVGPLLPFRMNMVRSKRAILHRLSHSFEREFKQTLNKVENGTLSDQALGEIQNLNQLYSMVSKFPEWPFDTSTLRKFISVFVSPLVPIILSWLFSLLVAG